mgnify:FL=1
MSKEQSNFIKGLGILLIMIHNFVDILLGISSNEMVYTRESTDAFLAHIFTTDCIWYFFSFVGWIGVPLFFFISGYGLTKKYNAANTIRSASYIKNHAVKLWMLMVPIYLVYFILYGTNMEAGLSHMVITSNHIQSGLLHITFTINLLSYGNNGFVIDPGVYWFFGAIFQFYILFLLLRKLDRRWLWILCGIFLIIHYFIIYAANPDLSRWMRQNFLGWGVPFMLGMIAARSQLNPSKRMNLVLCIGALLGLCACLVVKWLAPFTEVMTIIFFVTLSRMMTMKWMCHIGVISPSIFVLHPLIRQLIYSIFDSASHYPYTMTIAFTIITLLMSWVHHAVLGKTNKLLKRS